MIDDQVTFRISEDSSAVNDLRSQAIEAMAEATNEQVARAGIVPDWVEVRTDCEELSGTVQAKLDLPCWTTDSRVLKADDLADDRITELIAAGANAVTTRFGDDVDADRFEPHKVRYSGQHGYWEVSGNFSGGLEELFG